MSTPRVFISFDFDHDEELKKLFVGQAKNSKTPFEIGDWSSKSALPQSQWETIINDKINKCHMMIVLVGRHMANASGVNKEIQMAKNNNIPFCGVYVDGAGNLSTLPNGLQRNRTIEWTWPGIASAIDQMSNEGKNK